MATLIDDAATQLIAARREARQIERLPESCRPATVEDALLVQRRILELSGEKIGGWKCSLPKGDNLMLAPLPASTIGSGPFCPVAALKAEARIEPEIAFVMGRDLPPRATAYSELEVRDAISETRLVLELIRSRYVDPHALPFPEFLADSLSHLGLFVGPVLRNAFDCELGAIQFTVGTRSGTILMRDGRHPNEHPLRPLVWLVKFLSSRGETLKAGAIVTTGSYAGVLVVPSGIPLTIEYGNLGTLSVAFLPK